MTTEKLNDCTKIPGAVSRRSFLFGLGATAAVVAGGGLAGCAPQGSDAAPAAATSADAEAMAATGSATSDLTTDTVQDALAKPAKNQESKEADIVVVGSGIAGMSCAVEAALAGAKVVILEKNSTMTGGDSSICDAQHRSGVRGVGKGCAGTG